jgi:hypothetical protein
VVDEPVDQGRGHHRVAQDLVPLLEGAVRGDDDRAACVAARDEREQQVGRLALERQVADLVDDEQVVALEAAQLALELVSVLRRLEPGDPFLGSGEGDAVALLAGPDRECDREMRFSRPGRPEDSDVGVLVDPGERARCITSGRSAAGWACQSKSSSVFC